jgi:hypothetical protein
MSKYISKINQSIEDAEKFLTTAHKYLREIEGKGSTHAIYDASKTHSSMIRASLDLSSGLSDLRKGKYCD